MVNTELKKIQDEYTLVNNEFTPVTYVIKRMIGCNTYFTILDGSLDPSEELDLELTQDGDYQVIVTSQSLETLTYNIPYYLCLQTSLIENLYYALCGCECECTDCGSDCGFLLMTHAKMQTYKRLINPEGVEFFDTVYAETKCLISKAVLCSVTEEKIRGESTYNEELLQQLLALDYLALYFYECSLACLSGDEQYIKDKFKVEQLFCCIEALGIDITEIETATNNIL